MTNSSFGYVNIQRLSLGIVAVVAIATGTILAVYNEGENNSLSGILVRVGMMLAVTWLAFPTFQRPEGQQSIWFISAILLLVLIVAARPKLFFAITTILVVALAINWVFRTISKSVE